MIHSILSSVAATVVYVAYGHVVTDPDSLVNLARESTEHFSIASSPGAFLVEFFPLCIFFRILKC